MTIGDEKVVAFKTLAHRLQSAAYTHGQIDAEDRWSNRKYADAHDRSEDALAAVIIAHDSAYAELAAERDRLQAAYDALTGEKFSDRVHAALQSRAQAAESQLAGLRERVKVFLCPHLDAGTFGAPDWAIELYAILTDSTLAAADGGISE